MKKGLLEGLKLSKYCQMCGVGTNARIRDADGRDFGKARLEAAFDAGGKPKTLCFLCRMGSAELLAERNKKARELVGLIARMKLEQEYDEDDAPPSEDWISTLNELIESARQIRKELFK